MTIQLKVPPQTRQLSRISATCEHYLVKNNNNLGGLLVLLVIFEEDDKPSIFHSEATHMTDNDLQCIMESFKKNQYNNNS